MFSPYSVNKLQRTPLPALTLPALLLPTYALSPMQPFSTADVSFCRQREALQGPGFKQSDPFPPYSSGAHGVKTRSKTWKCKLLFQQKNENRGHSMRKVWQSLDFGSGQSPHQWTAHRCHRARSSASTALQLMNMARKPGSGSRQTNWDTPTH